MRRRRALALAVAGAVVTAVGVFIALFLTTGYEADEYSVALLENPSSATKVTLHPRVIEIHDATVAIRAEFVFYPGAKVDPVAYIPLASEIAAQGIRVWITVMPSDLAPLGARRFAKILPLLDRSIPVLLGGHDLGGGVAARFLSREPEAASGLVMVSAYPGRSTDLSHANLPVLAINGTNDQILDADRFALSRTLYPRGARLYEISGANHAGYGNYGQQRGDGVASITPARQQALVARLLGNFVTDL